MDAYVSIPRDFSKVKDKILFNLTKRQLICFSMAALIGVPFFFLLKRTGNISLAALGMMAVMMPLFLVAMYEKDGQPLEVVLMHVIQAKFLRPKIRPYRTNNYYAVLMRQEKVEREVEQIVKRAETRQRNLKQKGKKRGKKADTVSQKR